MYAVSVTLPQVVLSHFNENLYLSDNTGRLKVPIDSLNIMLICTLIWVTVRQIGPQQFVSEAAASLDSDLRILNKTIGFKENLGDIQDVVDHLRSQQPACI